MTSHELAKILLEMPDLPALTQDGMDPSDWVIVVQVELVLVPQAMETMGIGEDGGPATLTSHIKIIS